MLHIRMIFLGQSTKINENSFKLKKSETFEGIIINQFLKVNVFACYC